MYQEVEGYKKQLSVVKRNHDEEMNNLKDTVYKSMAGYLKVKSDKVALMLTNEHQMLASRFLVFKKRTQRQIDEITAILENCRTEDAEISLRNPVFEA